MFTLSFIFAGKVTVEERGKEIFTGEKYKTVMVTDEEGESTYRKETKTVKNTQIIRKIKKLSVFKKYTPLHTIFYALENLKIS
mgnify:CR=1 FL=1